MSSACNEAECGRCLSSTFTSSEAPLPAVVGAQSDGDADEAQLQRFLSGDGAVLSFTTERSGPAPRLVVQVPSGCDRLMFVASARTVEVRRGGDDNEGAGAEPPEATSAGTEVAVESGAMTSLPLFVHTISCSFLNGGAGGLVVALRYFGRRNKAVLAHSSLVARVAATAGASAAGIGQQRSGVSEEASASLLMTAMGGGGGGIQEALERTVTAVVLRTEARLMLAIQTVNRRVDYLADRVAAIEQKSSAPPPDSHLGQDAC